MDHLNNPEGAPPPPEANILTQLAKAMATLAQVSTMQLASNLSKAKAVQKPFAFKGEQGSDALLAVFTMWAHI